MSERWPISRRRLAGLVASLPLWRLAGGPALAEEPGPAEPEGGEPQPIKERKGRDRGIGGTGVIGTIRRFGSIVVNDLRIAYPADVTVLVDGKIKTAAALRLGQVVEVVAQGRPGSLATRRIEVTSEVVGPVESLALPRLSVMGQDVLVEGELPVPGLRVGEIVAVAGLRRLDGTIIASRIERRRGGRVQLAGVLQQAGDGSLHIGRLSVRGAPPALIGQRVRLSGRLFAGILQVETARLALALLLDQQLDFVSMEAYGERRGRDIVFGSGLQIAADQPQPNLPQGQETRIVADIRRGPDGGLGISSTRSNGPGAPGGPPGQPPPNPGDMPGPPPGGPAGPGGPGGPAGPGGTQGGPPGGHGGPGDSGGLLQGAPQPAPPSPNAPSPSGPPATPPPPGPPPAPPPN